MEEIISSTLSVPGSKKVLVIRVYALWLFFSLLPFPVGFVPSAIAACASQIPVFKIPLSMITVSCANVPSSSKKKVAVSDAAAAPSCMVTNGEATYSPIYFSAKARFFTNISISTPCPNASCTIMPVTSGAQMQSYSPGVIGSLVARSLSFCTNGGIFVSMSSKISIPPQPEQLSNAIFISSPFGISPMIMPFVHMTFCVMSLFGDKNNL